MASSKLLTTSPSCAFFLASLSHSAGDTTLAKLECGPNLAKHGLPELCGGPVAVVEPAGRRAVVDGVVVVKQGAGGSLHVPHIAGVARLHQFSCPAQE